MRKPQKPEKLAHRPGPHILTTLPGMGYDQPSRLVEASLRMPSYIRLFPASAGTSGVGSASLDRGLPWCEPCFSLIRPALPDES